jgi:hypothetical protein
MTERPSTLAMDAAWPTRAASRRREHVTPGQGGVRIIKDYTPIPPDVADTPETFVGGRPPAVVTPPVADTRDVRPPTRAAAHDDDDKRGKGSRR